MSPFERAAQEAAKQSDGSSVAGEGKKRKYKRKRKSKSTDSTRNRKEKVRERYSSAREDAQLEEIIPTTPEGAVRDEVSRGVGEVSFPRLVSRAVREGWLAPEDGTRVARHIDEMSAIIEDADQSAKAKIAAFKALADLANLGLRADQAQYERDNPQVAAQARGTINTVAVSIQSNMLAVSVLREALERDTGGGETALPPPIEPSALGPGRFDGEVEVGAASTSDQ